MTINAPELYMAGIWDWAILDGCFGKTGIKPTDIDGCIERKTHCLYLETKDLGVEVPLGQLITFHSFVAKGDSVLVIWGTKNQPKEIMVLSPRHPSGLMYCNANLDKLRELVAAWFEWADKGICPGVRL
jgi:hypothetical protein